MDIYGLSHAVGACALDDTPTLGPVPVVLTSDGRYIAAWIAAPAEDVRRVRVTHGLVDQPNIRTSAESVLTDGAWQDADLAVAADGQVVIGLRDEHLRPAVARTPVWWEGRAGLPRRG